MVMLLRIPEASKNLSTVLVGEVRGVWKPTLDLFHLRKPTVTRKSEYVKAQNAAFKKRPPSKPAHDDCVKDGFYKVVEKKYIGGGKYIPNYKQCAWPYFGMYLSSSAEKTSELREKKAEPVSG
jgi:hypothetical protein